MNKVIEYDLYDAKQRVILLVKQYTYDYCSDMLKEIKAAAAANSIDDVEMFVTIIRQAEEVSERQVKAVENARSITEILNATVYNDTVGNVLYECDDAVLGAILDRIIVENRLPF